jgi:23S rRNA pseudouridine2605 synthase
MASERLQKIIAQSGLASRRAAEAMITAGRVRVNGKVVQELGAKADARRDRIEVDGKRLAAEDLVYLVLHKPRGVVSTMDDPEGRPTVGELVGDVAARLFPVGRLDFATSGVLLMTNDGELANALLHPRKSVPKSYVVKLQGVVSDENLDRLREGVVLEDGPTRPADVRFLRHEKGKTWIEMTLREGRNQQIRRMAEAIGHPVMRLARLRFAGIDAEAIRPGQWRVLTVDEMRKLKRAYQVPKRVRVQEALYAIEVRLFHGKKAARGRGAKREERGSRGRRSKREEREVGGSRGRASKREERDDRASRPGSKAGAKPRGSSSRGATPRPQKSSSPRKSPRSRGPSRGGGKR